MCEHSSQQEQLAADAERASIKYKQVEFLMDRIGEEFDAVISGVTEWGIYAEIVENKCEGMIPIVDLEDDYYYFDEENYCVVGRSTGRRFQLGDPLKIRIANANLEKKQLDFVLAEMPLKPVEKQTAGLKKSARSRKAKSPIPPKSVLKKSKTTKSAKSRKKGRRK